ncbi:MAG: PrsW family glutamic-type intramembrane protease, partial [Cyanobacteria bacterium P01_A01_bin.83]
IIPYHQVLSQELYRSNTVKLLLCFGLFPWVIGFFASSDTNLKDIAWILGIYYAFIWGIVLHNLIQPTQFSLQTALKCVCFTAFVGIPLLLFIQKVPPVSLLYAVTDSSNSILRLIGYVLGVGILEESCKALPVYLFILRPGKLQEPLSAAFYGAMSGLGFAIAEGGHYSLLYASELVKGNMALTNHILVTTVRFISLPLIHAIWAGIVGYFIGLAAINPSRQKAIIFLGVTIAAVLHGVYNTFANSFIGLGVLAFSILLFVTYLHRSEVMIEEMKQAEAKYQESA